MTPRPYSRMFQAVGTQGYAAKYPAPEVQLSPMAAAKVGIEIEEGGTPLNTIQIERLLNHYAPSFSSETIALARQLDFTRWDVLLYGLTARSVPARWAPFGYGWYMT